MCSSNIHFQADLTCRNTKQSVGAIYTRTNFVTLKYVTDGWGTDSNGFKMVITAVKDPSKFVNEWRLWFKIGNRLICPPTHRTRVQGLPLHPGCVLHSPQSGLWRCQSLCRWKWRGHRYIVSESGPDAVSRTRPHLVRSNRGQRSAGRLRVHRGHRHLRVQTRHQYAPRQQYAV